MRNNRYIVALATGVLCIQHVQASFNILHFFEADDVRREFDLSPSCLSALNTTVSCNEDLATLAANGPDLFSWSEEAVGSLCTSTCSSSLRNWLEGIEGSCTAEQSSDGNGFVAQVQDVARDYLYGQNLVCLRDSQQRYCFYESQSWEGSDYIRWDPFACENADPSDNPSECSDPEFSTSQISSDMMAITNLYSRNLYCSECFLKLWRQRLVRHNMPASDSTDFLVDQFSSLQSSCSTQMPYSTPSRTSPIQTITSTTDEAGQSSTAFPGPIDIDSCTGRVINATSEVWKSCDMLSAEYNVSTTALREATGDRYCFFASSICLPDPCPVEKIFRSNCSEIADRLSTPSRNVTESMLLRWNSIEDSCDKLHPQYICVGPPGGEFEATATIHAPTAPGAYYTTATPARPTGSGVIEDCGRYHDVVAGDTCASLALRYSITLSQLYDYNAVLNEACNNLWLGYSICVARVVSGPRSTDGSCGPNNRFATCEGTSFGPCCSLSGRCGGGEDFCSPDSCFSGACESSEKISQDGACNATVTCRGSSFGNCCSTSGWCGSSAAYCGPGNCYSGDCDPDIEGPSIDGSCGPYFAGNKTCTNTQFGACCSTSGFCGDSSEYCGAGNCYSGACAGGSGGGGGGSSSCTVEVTFDTSYPTEWGESIWVVGSLPELGEWDVARGLMLEGRATGTAATGFSNTIRLPADTGVGYKFVLLRIDGTAVWEEDPNRGVDTPRCGGARITIGGAWHGTATAPVPVCEAVAVNFEARVSTAFGESVFLVGSLPALGAWNTDNAVALSADDYTQQDPVWKGPVTLPLGQDVEFKFIRMQTDGTFAWEADPNRFFTTPTGCEGSTSTVRGSWNG